MLTNIKNLLSYCFRIKKFRPKIDLNDYYYGDASDGEADLNMIVAELLNKDILFIHRNDKDESPTFSVICNDVFAWGCADLEEIKYNQISKLFDLYVEHDCSGATIWCCLNRKMQPQKPMADLMKKSNHWPPEMDNLARNGYDIWIEKGGFNQK